MIRTMSEVLETALEADAYETCLSGSGLLLPFFAKKDIVNVQKAMIKR
jgi:homoserine kinase